VIDVLVLGDLNPDLVLRGDVVPRFGQAEQLLDAATLVLGGSAAIMAHALARLGRTTRLAALIGDDNFGDIVIELLTAQGVDTQAVSKDPDRPTGLTVVLSQGQERAVLTFPGTIAALTVDHAIAALESAARDGARHLHVSSLFLQPSLAAGLAVVFERAHTLGLSTSLDPNFDPAQRWVGVEELLPHLDVFLPNRSETLAIAERIAGQSFDDVAAAGLLLASRGPVVVITDGRNGAQQVNPDGTQFRDAGDPVEAVDTTGAGDTFAAAYLDSLLRGLPAAECLRRAVLAGALSTSAIGGTAGQPTLDQLVQVTLDHRALTTEDADATRQQ
jgi:sugar/nucleoside kinase (ribokinase family)